MDVSNKSGIEKLTAIMKALRTPETGCPWDLEQDFHSITRHTIEEAYEVVDAIENGTKEELKSELGDLLFQVIFYSQMADEEQSFNFDDVVTSISNKMIKRHPHVFGTSDGSIDSAKAQEEAWEKQKEEERREQSAENKSNYSALDGVAKYLPALTRAAKIQQRASKVGFDWPDHQGVINKAYEELKEIEEATLGNGDIGEEIGDLLFCISHLCNKFKHDPEELLRKATNKFEHRFKAVEQSCIEHNTPIETTSLDQLEVYWQQAKITD